MLENLCKLIVSTSVGAVVGVSYILFNIGDPSMSPALWGALVGLLIGLFLIHDSRKVVYS